MKYVTIRIKDATYREFLKLRSVAELSSDRRVTFDELLSSMIAFHQNLLKGGKITKT